MARYHSTAQSFTLADLAYHNDRGTVAVIGIISVPPDIRDQNIRLRLEVESVGYGGQTYSVGGTALIYADRLGDYRYGDQLRAIGQLQTPPRFDTFSFRDYLANEGVYSVMLRAQITRLDANRGSPILAALYDAREAAHRRFQAMLPAPESSLLSGIVLGETAAISPQVAEQFRITGTSHLLAISGANIAVIAAFLLMIIRRLPRKISGKWRSTLWVMLGIGGYTLFVGAEASVVRAAIMAVFVLWAEQFGRKNDGITALAASVWLMTILNPRALFDLGLIMSAAATLGLLLYLPMLTRLAESIISRLFAAETAQNLLSFLAETVLIAFSVQVMILPISLSLGSGISLNQIAVNVLVAPAQAPIMILGVLAAIAGAIIAPIGQVLGWLAALPVSFTYQAIRVAAQDASQGSIMIGGGPLAIYYLLVLGITAFSLQHPAARRRWWNRLRAALPTGTLLSASAGALILLIAALRGTPDGKLHLHALDVGDYRAILITTPNGGQILVDSGENPMRLQSQLGAVLPYYQHHLDSIILLNDKERGNSALPPLLDRYAIRVVLSNGVLRLASNPVYRAIETRLTDQGLPITPLMAGYRLQTSDGVLIRLISQSPPLLSVEFGSFRALILPEMDDRSANQLLTAGDLPATLILTTKRGIPMALMEAFRPQAMVVSADSVAFALPDLPVMVTGKQGRIDVSSDGQTLWLQAEKFGR
ncbi:MAG: hypothetical protein OHK0023_12140 [Anaerolineae bacterium]